MRKLLFTILIITNFLPISSLAADFQSSERYIISTPIEDDLYVAGGQVKIKSDIKGDLILAGGEIEISGNVNDDIIAAGGRIYISGEVGDDVRIAGGEIEIHKSIGDDLIIGGGGRVTIYKGVEIGGDLIINGGEIRIKGNIKGKIIINGGRVILDGNVGSNAEINAGLIEINGSIGGGSKLVAGEIILGPNSSFKNEVYYWTEKGKIDFGEANAIYNEDLGKKFTDWHLDDGGFDLSIKILMLLSGMLAIYLLLFGKKYFVNTANKLERYPIKCFGFGVLYFVLTPIFLILLMITVIGIPFALLGTAAFIFTIVFACPVTAVLLAFYWDKHKRGKWNKTQLFGVSVGILATIKFSFLIPFFGFLLSIIVIVSAFGAFIMQDWEYIRKYF